MNTYEPNIDELKNPVKLWNIYEDEIADICIKLSGYYNYHFEDLLAESYLSFDETCRRFDPNYGGGGYKFHLVMYSRLRQHVRSFIQRQRKKESHYVPNLDGDNYTAVKLTPIVTWEDDFINQLEGERLLSLLDPADAEIVNLRLQGYKQWEIAEQVGVSQSWVSSLERRLKQKNRKALR